MNKKRWFSLLSVGLVLVLLAGITRAQEPASTNLGTGFTYQGQLKSGGLPYTGTCDLRFNLYDDPVGGSPIGPTQTKTGVSLTDGYLTVELDFGVGAFQGDARWLTIEVCCPTGGCTYTPLTPRQPVTATPYALALPGLWTQPNSTSPNLIGGYSGNWVTSGAYGATIGGGGYAGMLNRVTDILSTVGGGADNQAGDGDGDPISVQYATVGGGGANTAGNFNATVGGGYGNNASSPSATVGGGWYNKAENMGAVAGGGLFNHAAGPLATVGGGEGNNAGGDWATIAGGYYNVASGYESTVGGGYSNDATGAHATIAGGEVNTASGYESTVGGGEENTAGDSFATVAGGGYNNAGGGGTTISGGYHNIASGFESAIGGGEWNTAGGGYATIPGGSTNTADGDYSFAAGRRAKANNDGSFVWADSTDADFTDSISKTFNIRAANGTKLFADNGSSGLVVDNDAHFTNGDAMDVFANVSKGNYWATAYLQNMGTSPAIYAEGGGTYAAYFFGQIYTTGCVGCVLIQTGLNDGVTALQPGDLAAISGLAEPLDSGSQPILRVHRATAGEAIVGVVQARGVRSQSARDGKRLESINRADGDARPGDYLFLVVYGPTQVKADAAAGAITAGTRLTASSQPGHARALQTRTLDGMEVAEAAPSVGIALGTLDSGAGLIAVFVTLH